VIDEHDEGWFTDPYGRHEARWISAGSPTKLVRDGDVESYDEPPDEEPSQEAIKLVREPIAGDHGHRADEAEADSLPTTGEAINAAVFGAVSSWHLKDHKPRDR
jgi:hypothetical protein